MQLTALLALLPLAAAVPFTSTSGAPPATSSPSYTGRRILFRSGPGCMVAKGMYDGASVGISTDCTNLIPEMRWDTGYEYSVGVIRLSGTDLCLSAGEWDARADGVQVTLRSCSVAEGPKHGLRWWYPRNGRVEFSGPILRAHSAPPHSNLCLDLTDGDLDGDLQVWTCYAGNANQRFDLGD